MYDFLLTIEIVLLVYVPDFLDGVNIAGQLSRVDFI